MEPTINSDQRRRNHVEKSGERGPNRRNASGTNSSYLGLGLGLKFRAFKYWFSSSGAAVIFVADIVSLLLMSSFQSPFQSPLLLCYCND